MSEITNNTLSRRKFLQVAAAAALAVSGAATLEGCRSNEGDALFKGIRTFTDDAGRELKIPIADRLSKVYFTSGLAQIYCITLAPDLMGATCARYDAVDKQYLPDELQGLVYLGSTDTGDMDVESVMNQGIQLIFSISSTTLDEQHITEAQDIQEKSNIPVVLLDGSDDKIGHVYEAMGDILGRQERAKTLGDYCMDAYAKVTEAVKDIPEEEKVTVYYAEGPKGLQTEPSSSQHAFTFNAAGGKVVAEVDLFDDTGMTDVSLESVIKWNPEVIITWDSETRGGAADDIRSSSDWANIKAVKDGRVYAMPNIPIAWVDRPMACNRCLGVQWLANMFYPDKYDVDMVEVGCQFYELFYGKPIDETAMTELLDNSYPPTPRIK